jgi:hypothetical protein
MQQLTAVRSSHARYREKYEGSSFIELMSGGKIFLSVYSF